VNGVNGTPISTPINYYVTPNGTGASAWLSAWLSANGDSTSLPGIPGNTGTTGCGVVTGLPVAATATYPQIAQWTWTVELTPNPGYVATTEASDANPAGPPLSAPITLHEGEISYALNTNSQQFQVAIGVLTTVNLQTLNFATTPALVTQCEPATGIWTTGTPTSTPPPSCDDSAATPLTAVPITVANPGVGPTGQYTFGSNTQSTAQMLLYPFASGYSVWSGEMPESNPGDAPSGSPLYAPDSGVTLPIGTSTTATVVVPVYPLDLKVTGPNSPTATETDGAAYSYTPNPPISGVSSTGMPLGQYKITATGMTLPWPTQFYVWITPTGICESQTQLSLPSPCSHPAPDPIPVTD
jgi:hypothetical protein